MGRHSDSGSGSDDERRHSKKARKDGDRERKPSKSNKSSHKSHKSSKSNKKESRKESKKDGKKSSKGERKHSKSHKSERKRKRSNSASSTDDSSDSSRSGAPSPARKPSSTSAAAASSSKAPAVPLQSESSVARCLELIETLLKHGGGERAESLQQLQFMLFKLDSGSSVDVSAIPDALVKHILSTMLRELGCHVRRDPETDEQGFMTPVDARNRPAYKLLSVLDAAFNPKKPVAATAAQVIGPIGPSMPPPAASAAAASAAASSADATATAAPRMLGPAMPKPEDFERLAAGDDFAGAAAAAADDDDAGNFGPKMPSQMTAQEVSIKAHAAEDSGMA